MRAAPITPPIFPARGSRRCRLRRSVRSLAAPFEIVAGIVAGACQAAADEARRGGRLRRLSVPAGDDRGVLARLPTAIIEQNAVLGRANRIVTNYVRAIAAGFPMKRFVPKDMSKVVSPAIRCGRKSCLWGAPYDAPTADGPCACSCSAAARARAPSAKSCRRRSRCLPHEHEARLSCRAAMPPGRSGAGARVYANAEIRAELAPFFNDLPRAWRRPIW